MRARKLSEEGASSKKTESEILEAFQPEIISSAAESITKYALLPISACCSLISSCCMWPARQSQGHIESKRESSTLLKKQ